MPSFTQLLHYDPIDHPPHRRRFLSTAVAATTLNPSTPLLTLIVIEYALPPTPRWMDF
jgi:hypothetical protein